MNEPPQDDFGKQRYRQPWVAESLFLWRYSKPAWTRSCAACCRWPCFGMGVGLDDPQRSLPTPTILWFCNKHEIHLAFQILKRFLVQEVSGTSASILKHQTASYNSRFTLQEMTQTLSYSLRRSDLCSSACVLYCGHHRKADHSI